MMKPFLKLIHSIWLVTLFVVFFLPAPAVSLFPAQFAYDGLCLRSIAYDGSGLSASTYDSASYDGPSQTRIAYDGAFLSVFNYDSASMLPADETGSPTAATRSAFAAFARLLAAKTGAKIKPGSIADKPPGWNESWEWHSSTRAKPGSDGWRWRDSQGGEWRRHVPDKHSRAVRSCVAETSGCG